MKIRNCLIVFLSSISILLAGQTSFNESSVLKSGKWFKVKITDKGIYKLKYEDLVANGFNAPENIRIYGQGGKQLSYYNDSVFEDDLEEIPLYSSNTGGFGPGDYYLFYGEGVESIYYDEAYQMFRQKIHDYALSNYYFITASFGPGKRITEMNTSGLTANQSRSTYDWIGYYEVEKLNLINSGRQWFSTTITSNVFTKQFTANNIDLTSPVSIITSAAVRSAGNRAISVSVNGTSVSSLSFSNVNIEGSENIYAIQKMGKNEFITNSSQIDVKLSFNGNDQSDQAFVDYITLNARCILVADNALFFRDYGSIGDGNITDFTISNTSTTYQVWNVTDNSNVYKYSATSAGNITGFKAKTDSLQEFVAVNVSGTFSSPVYSDDNLNDVGWIENQNLHGLEVPELLIVTHPDFLNQAQELAQLHRDYDNMEVEVVTTSQVYNEFSSGKPDASAIRNLSRMFYERSSAQASFKYLLLFGDGSYDNRTITGNNPNYIPTYESENSLDPISSYVTDDFYALLELGEGHTTGTFDIGVGRLPVNSDGEDKTEAQGLVEKIKTYYSAEVMSDWRNNMIFLGDDGESGWDNKVFMEDSDMLTKIVAEKEPTMNFKKIYLDAYQQISSSTGASYPEVEVALKNAFNKGALVFNYMGHGGELGITQEKVLQKTDFENMTNAPYFPLFVTATCQLSRYDNVDILSSGYAKKVSAGEAALLNPDGGAIALLTTTRLVYQSSNKLLSETLYNNLFKKDENGKPYKLGDILRISKNTTSAGKENTLKFSLLGDPAITLAYGEYKLIVDSINNKPVISEIDTLNALREVLVCGFVAHNDSTIIENFNGIVYISVFDKIYTLSTLGNDGIPTFDFTMQDKLLFRGKASVKNGRYSAKFKVPKDISYSFGNGKIALYAQNGVIDAKGYYNEFIIGGTTENLDYDIDGPEISLFMNDESFIDGGITNPDPILLVNVYDTNGINTTGNGIGHDLTGILDDNMTQSYLMNDYFIGALDNYRKGSVQYPINDLEEGHHSITVKVWDTYNNSSTSSISFYVVQADNLVVNELLNYPNPARTYTTFQYSHNKPGTTHSVQIDVYDITGRLIHHVNRTLEEDGFVSEPLTWNFGTSVGGSLKSGVYPYRVTVKTSDGYEGIQSGRLIIIP